MNFKLWKYIGNYKFHNVFLKNLKSILIVMLLPFIGMSIAVYYYYSSVSEKELSTINLNAMYSLRNTIDGINGDIDRYMNSLISDTYVNFFMTQKSYVFNDLNFGYAYQNINTSLNTFALSRDYIDSIYLYSNNSNYIISNKSSGFLNKYSDTSWHPYYQGLILKNEYTVVTRKEGSNANQMSGEQTSTDTEQEVLLSFIRLYTSGESQEGAIVININIRKLNQLIYDATNTFSDNTFIIDKNNKILYCDEISLCNKTINEIDYLNGINYSDIRPQLIINSVDKGNKLVSYIKSGYNNMGIISILNSKLYDDKMNLLRILLVIFVFVSFIISSIIALIISVKIYHPIDNIVSIINNPEDWIKPQETTIFDKVDEFKYITSQIVRTFATSKQMEEELAIRLSMLKRTQAIALQSQINPHFLFNTLQAANLLAYSLTKSENKVTLILDYLSKLLRNSLRTKEHLVTIVEEMEIARYYIEIQKIRYKDKFVVEWDMDEEIINSKIPKITLQPIIENCIYHGIKPMGNNCVITISGYLQQDNVYITINDNGIGIAKSRLKEIVDSLNQEEIKENDSIGLSNVHQRIKLIFGDQYGLKIESTPGDTGTKVSIILPFVK